MNNLTSNFKSIEQAKQIRENHGGTIFVFPIQEDNSFSSYSVVIYAGGKYFVYPNATDISEAASRILTLLEEVKKNGMDADYTRNVRLVSHQAQMDAPSTIMRKLKKENISKPFLKEGKDYKKESEGEDEQVSARGVLKYIHDDMEIMSYYQ